MYDLNSFSIKKKQKNLEFFLFLHFDCFRRMWRNNHLILINKLEHLLASKVHKLFMFGKEHFNRSSNVNKNFNVNIDETLFPLTIIYSDQCN